VPKKKRYQRKTDYPNPAQSPKGPLTLAIILSNVRLYTVWDDWRHNVPVEITSKKPEVGVSVQTVTNLRARIREAVERDPDTTAFRRDMRQLYPKFKKGTEANLESPFGSSDRVAFAKGLGIYRNEDSLDVTVQSPEEVQKRRLAQLEAGSGKVKK
jgi:hypothetical protein